jgi:uncharacterized protein (DUF2147 family)
MQARLNREHGAAKPKNEVATIVRNLTHERAAAGHVVQPFGSDILEESAMKQLGIAAVVLCGLCAPALAGPAGEWRIADGAANVSIRPCGHDLCGHDLCGYVSWAKDADMTGKPVLLMKPNGAVWSGSVVNARDGQTYQGRIFLRGNEVLKVEGCILGGMIRGGQQWSRLK